MLLGLSSPQRPEPGKGEKGSLREQQIFEQKSGIEPIGTGRVSKVSSQNWRFSCTPYFMLRSLRYDELWLHTCTSKCMLYAYMMWFLDIFGHFRSECFTLRWFATAWRTWTLLTPWMPVTSRSTQRGKSSPWEGRLMTGDEGRRWRTSQILGRSSFGFLVFFHLCFFSPCGPRTTQWLEDWSNLGDLRLARGLVSCFGLL